MIDIIIALTSVLTPPLVSELKLVIHCHPSSANSAPGAAARIPSKAPTFDFTEKLEPK